MSQAPGNATPAPYVRRIADEIRNLTNDHDSRNDLLYLVYAVLTLAKGESVDAADVHDAWCAVADHDGSDAEQMVPFDELLASAQARDKPFVDAIRDVARRQTRRGS